MYLIRNRLNNNICKSILILLGVFFCISNTVYAEETIDNTLDTQLNERILSVPVDDWMSLIKLQVTVFKPAGSGPFPLAVLNHGKDEGDAHSLSRYRSAYIARYFVSRGFAVVMPMLRGFAGSGGTFTPMGCDAENEGLYQARDIRTVINYMAKQPDIDVSRIVIAGQSYGGWNTLALGTLNIPGVKGLVNFAGGRNAPRCPSWPLDLAVAAGHYGQQTKVPSIWFYGDNDAKFSQSTWRGMYEHYTAAGGQAELVAYGNFMKDSHNFLGSVTALSIWIPRMDAFLLRIGLPNKNVYPELLPAFYPAPTHFAAIDDVNAIPLLNDKGRQSYKQFLSREMPRVFAIAQDGTTVSTNGGFDPLERALEICRKNGRNCRPYAVDEEVVWPKRFPIPSATHFASLNDVAAVPYLNERGREGYKKFLTLQKPRAFVIAPDGGW
jgi:dienelactone hydrolase